MKLYTWCTPVRRKFLEADKAYATTVFEAFGIKS